MRCHAVGQLVKLLIAEGLFLKDHGTSMRMPAGRSPEKSHDVRILHGFFRLVKGIQFALFFRTYEGDFAYLPVLGKLFQYPHR